MNQRRSHFPLLELSAGLGGVSFGISRSLSASPNAFCGRKRKNVSHAFPSRRGDWFQKVWKSLPSATARPFGAAECALDSLRAFRSDQSRMERQTPNHALQPTATLAFSSRCPALTSTGSVTAGAPAMNPGTCRAFASRRLAHTRAPRSRWLSLGSLGVARTFQTIPHSNKPHETASHRRNLFVCQLRISC